MLKIFHWCKFNPIISMYWTFNCRKIIYECSCGKRKVEDCHRNFDTPFPKDTDSIDFKDFNAIASGSNYTRLGTIVIADRQREAQAKNKIQ